MLIPTPRLLVVTGICLAIAVAASLEPSAMPILLATSVMAVLVAVFDAVRLLREHVPQATRHLPGTLPLGMWQDVALTLRNRTRRPIVFDLIDHFPAAMTAEGLPHRIRLDAQQSGRIHYRVRPLARGDQMFSQVEVRIGSALGLWQVRRRLASDQTVRVYPNFAAIARYAAFAMDQRLMQLGIVRQRRRGEGQDFRQLRDYRSGDPLRSVDWKATARTGRLISREFQEERNQQVVFMLDCGRRMLAHDGALSHFDHVINAALLLASVSLRHGDAVGLLTMGTESVEPARFVAPRRSPTTINALLDAVYDLQPTYGATDYLRAAVDLAGRVKKRALIVLLTNLHEEETAELIRALEVLRTRHLVVVASLREQALRETLIRTTPRLADALTHAAVAEYLLQRTHAFRQIERQGTVCIDVEPVELGVALVNRYLQIKRAGRL